MKSKLDLAHEYAMSMKSDVASILTIDNLIHTSWVYADDMYAENEKREKIEAEEKRKQMRELLNADNTFIEKEGQHFDDVEWQPDWSVAPDDCDWFAIDADKSAYFYNYKPYIKDGYRFWGDPDILCDGHSTEIDSSFNYSGHWRDSLRKRPK